MRTMENCWSILTGPGGPKRNIILVHGEEKATQALAGALRERQANPVSIAQLGSAMVL